MVLSHNHPSGNDRPSEADDRLTEQFIKAGKLLDITIIDHVIIAGHLHYSYAEEECSRDEGCFVQAWAKKNKNSPKGGVLPYRFVCGNIKFAYL